MIVSEFSLNFDLVKEILKIQCQSYILMKKVIFSEEDTCANEVFHSTVRQPFQVESEKKKDVW